MSKYPQCYGSYGYMRGCTVDSGLMPKCPHGSACDLKTNADGCVAITEEEIEDFSVCFGWYLFSRQCRDCDNFQACNASAEGAVPIIEED